MTLDGADVFGFFVGAAAVFAEFHQQAPTPSAGRIRFIKINGSRISSTWVGLGSSLGESILRIGAVGFFSAEFRR